MPLFVRNQILIASLFLMFTTPSLGQNSTAAAGLSGGEQSIATPAPVPAARCYPALITFSKWSKPGNSLIPKMARIKEGAQQLDFSTGKSAFFGVRFADIKPNHLIQVLLIRDPNLTKLSTVFIPSYVLLDKDFCEITAQKEFIFREKKWANAFSQSLEIADVIVDKDENPAYLLLYSDARKNGSEVIYRDSAFNYKLPTTIRSEHGYLQLQTVKSN